MSETPSPAPPTAPPPPARKPLGVVRVIFAAIGVLIMIFAGGCTLLLTGPYLLYDPGSALLALLFGGVPFAIGLLIWWLAVKAGRS